MKALGKTLSLMLASLLITGSITLTACSGNQPLQINGQVPNFKLPDYTGKTVSLSDYSGKAVLLHFWDSTFDTAINELTFLQKVHEEWQNTGKTVLLTIDVGESAETVKAFMESQKFTFPVLLDTDGEVAQKYNLTVQPSSIFISQDGKMKLNVVGPFKDKAAVEKQLAEFLP
jgi:peroxiredoxin